LTLVDNSYTFINYGNKNHKTSYPSKRQIPGIAGQAQCRCAVCTTVRTRFGWSHPPSAGGFIDNTGIIARISPKHGRRPTTSVGCENNTPENRRPSDALRAMEGRQTTDDIQAGVDNIFLPVEAGGQSHGGRVRPSDLKQREKLPPQAGGACQGHTRPLILFQEGWLDELLDKIHQVESSGRINPPAGDDGRAVGPMQLHKDVIIDVNQYFNVNYSFEDRRNLQKSKEIAKLYIAMWLEIHKEQVASLIFHYGPSQWKQDVDGYWLKIKELK